MSCTGIMNLKTHCKLCLVIRKEERCDSAGTSILAPATTTGRPAQVYTDFGLFTANPRIAADASELFNYLTGYSRQRELSGADRRARCAARSADGADRARNRTPRRTAGPPASSSRTTLFRPRHHSRPVSRVARRRADPGDRARHHSGARIQRRTCRTSAPTRLDPAAECFWMPTTPIRIRSDGATATDRALTARLPLAIEQDLVWRPAAAGDPAHSIVSHGEPFTGREPALRDFFERIRPLVTRALVDGPDDRWPLITLNLDFKDSHRATLRGDLGIPRRLRIVADDGARSRRMRMRCSRST